MVPVARTLSANRQLRRLIIHPRESDGSEWWETGLITDPETGRLHEYLAFESDLIYDGDLAARPSPWADFLLRQVLHEEAGAHFAPAEQGPCTPIALRHPRPQG